MRVWTAAVTLLVMIGWAVAPVTAQSPPKPTASEPTFSVEQTEIDLGTIKAGTDAVAEFVFHNRGEQPVKILKAKPS